MKPLVLYHANCADGFGAAFAAWLKLGDEAEYVACSYGKQADTFLETYLGRRTERSRAPVRVIAGTHILEEAI